MNLLTILIKGLLGLGVLLIFYLMIVFIGDWLLEKLLKH